MDVQSPIRIRRPQSDSVWVKFMDAILLCDSVELEKRGETPFSNVLAESDIALNMLVCGNPMKIRCTSTFEGLISHSQRTDSTEIEQNAFWNRLFIMSISFAFHFVAVEFRPLDLIEKTSERCHSVKVEGQRCHLGNARNEKPTSSTVCNY